MYKIKKEKLTELFRCIASARELYLPVKISGQVNFASWEEGDEVDLDTLKTCLLYTSGNALLRLSSCDQAGQ